MLGFTLATISGQGLLKTAALATLVLPLPRPRRARARYVRRRGREATAAGRPIYVADARHLHHRFMRIGFSEPRTVVYLWTWCATLALAALATRFAPPHPHGRWSATNVVIDVTAGVTAIAFSLYIVYVLEIVKLQAPRALRRSSTRRAA
jgi:UDP-GlcNAc:undecaprenyl-phosphate GlcNAc-1-phosphate transferase